MSYHPKKRLYSFKYAFKGIVWAFSTQPNLLIHLVAAVCAIVLGFYVKLTKTEWVIIVGCIGMVLIVEFINTCIEWLVDSIYKERHVTAGKIKDVAAGAVLIAAITAAVIGVIIFYPYFF